MLGALKKSEFLKNVAVLISGTAIAQGLMIASSPLLSRLYNPEVFGIFAIYTSIISVLSVIMTWQYDTAIVLPKKEEDGMKVAIFSSYIVIAMTILVFIIMLLFGDFIANLLGITILSSWLWVVPISVCALGFYQILNNWSIRRKRFKRLSTSQLSRSVSVVSTQVSGGFIGLGSIGLIGGQIIGQLMASIILGYQVWKDDRREILQANNNNTMGVLARKYKNFPLYSVPQSLLNAVSRNIPPFLLAFFYGPGVVGFYALSLKLVQIPADVIGESIRNVFFQKASEHYNENGKIRSLMIRATCYLALIAIIPAIIVICFGPQIFSLILGNQWYTAGEYAKWMVVWLFFGFINIPAFVVAQIVGLQKHLLIYEVCLLFFRSAALFIGLKFYNALTGIMLFCIVAGGFNLLLIAGVIFLIKKIELYQMQKEKIELVN
ncbi:lipopolysaccharide biosynthesis protein [Bacillus massiliigorillae]|uniref:lipopolysaccharide biosynthesis protein n=1 Tax=Bacillus massiliigorillae TaxID=1243664 RepID=UPI00039DDBDC|nr:oligosaccharide flippase family protein [Bacillus massiliigorillae]